MLSTNSRTEPDMEETDPIITTSAQVKETQQKRKKKNDDKNQTLSQKELRQMEVKLRKWEDKLTLKERAMQEGDTEKSLLRSYIQELEANVSEMERTNRIIIRKVSSMEMGLNNESDVIPPNMRASPHETLIRDIHQRVTRLVLKKVDRDIQSL